ncbi:unnamed protein product [Adineta steineri]|uniref:Uncharacterized protein n=1 Tax=Adineta steineri TaxID=433720 RepID=A0A818RFR4_9BILA|nr:unnamed protein product [Adineta steineri]CAF0961557.1 unnamed protein product [Adineta steineri]CAF3649945.1 unnamed protein product [Adineta steineri]CAF3804207.1 unnamed protein product [Adineta steineri]
MKRIQRLGSISFVTVLLSLVFHLLAMSNDEWKSITCHGCGNTTALDDVLGSWTVALTERCYSASVAKAFSPNGGSTGITASGFRAQVCIENQYLMVKDIRNASYCLDWNERYGDVGCTLIDYDTKACKCDYSTRIKLTLAMTILTSLSLGILIFISHLVAFVTIDYVIEWLIPACYSLLFFAILCMIITLFTAGTGLDDEINQLRYSQSLFEVAYFNDSSATAHMNAYKKASTRTYSVKLGWCFGMEVMALYFSIVSAVLYLLMYLVKRHPNAIKAIK